MKKILPLFLLLLCACSPKIEREDYYVLSLDGYTVVPGYDDVSFLKLVFDFVLPQYQTEEKMEAVDLYLMGTYLAMADFHPLGKETEAEKALLNRFTFYLDDYYFDELKIDQIPLKSSIRENCELFGGEYIERNGCACAFGKKVDGKDNIVILHGDILAQDQDALDHIEIYVE